MEKTKNEKKTKKKEKEKRIMLIMKGGYMVGMSLILLT